MTSYPADTLGFLYLLCFDRPLGNLENTRAQAGHYLGWALDVPARVATHAAGRGAAITAAAVQQGITWQVYYRRGTPALERYFKLLYKQTPRCCPRCAHRRGRRPAHGFQPLEQLALPLATQLLDDDFPPVPPTARMDYYEIVHLRDWQAQRALLIPAPNLTALDDLL